MSDGGGGGEEGVGGGRGGGEGLDPRTGSRQRQPKKLHSVVNKAVKNRPVRMVRWCPLRQGCRLFVLQRVSSTPPGASCTVVLRK